MSQRVNIYGLAKTEKVGALGKPSTNSANLSYILDPKPKRAYHGQGEVCRKIDGGPNPYVVQLIGMTCGKK
jgi:hypothetical protein